MSFLGITNFQNASGANNITQAQLKTWSTKKPFNYQVAWSNQRVSISASSDGNLWNFPITKISSTSILFIHGWLHFKNTVNGAVGWYVEVDGTRSYRGTPYSEYGGSGATTDGTNDRRSVITCYLPDVYKTGTLNMKIGWAANDGGANSPSDIWNPHYASDDGRTPFEQGSLLHIWEVEP